MTRFAVAVFSLLLSFSLVAEEAQRYLVATRGGARVGVAEALRGIQRDPAHVAAAPFDAFDGFGATLTSSEVAQLRTSERVRWIEPVLERRAQSIGFQSTPWGIHAVHAVQAREAVPKQVTNVVVIDTGVDGGHPELEDIYAGGWNFFSGKNEAIDKDGHGTHVAGTIAAADNEAGVLGVAPESVRLWGVKVLADDGFGTTESVIGGIDWVVKQKALLGGNWVANLSLGASDSSNAEREAFARATAAGIIVVAASGNGSMGTKVAPVMFPAAYPGVLAVGAATEAFARADFSNPGPELDFVAPGTNVHSLSPRGLQYMAYVKAADRVFLANVIRGSKIGSLTSDFVYCGLGKASDFPAAVKGKIALIKRGELPFMDKTRNAKAAGAIAVAIFNHEHSSNTSWTLYADEAAQKEEWPIAIALTKSEGDLLAAEGSGSLTVGMEPNDYGFKSGTSMATPHVAGAVAFLWSIAPEASADTIVNALRVTAGDLGAPGPDPDFGSGAIDLLAAARFLVPGAYSSTRTGRATLRRGRK